MEFEWDEAKHERNSALRGIGFDHGAMIFEGRVVERLDDRQNYGEVRIRAVGVCGTQILHVVYTDRDEVRRIISVRSANLQERAAWQSFE